MKNYGIRPRVAARLLRQSAGEAYRSARETLAGDGRPTGWLADRRDVLAGIATGGSDGFVARARDRSPTRNPHGISTRADRAVTRYEMGPA